MKLRQFLCALPLLMICTALHAQKVRGVFSLADRITTESQIAHAGRQPIKPIPPKPSEFQPLPFNQAAPVWNISADADFVLDLLDRGLKADALTLLGEGNYAPSDTLHWLRGLALFDDRQFQASSQWLEKAGGAFRERALYFDSVALLQLDSLEKARWQLKGLPGELAAFQRAGLSLAAGDIDAYRQEEKNFGFKDFRLSEGETAFGMIAKAQEKSRRKSPALAGLISAVIPGAGKVYAGRLGEGVAALLTVGALAAITADQWNHHGAGDWRTIAAGSLCAVFYIGNIYGSCISVGIQKQELRDETKALVIYNLTVPLHGFFR